jgi:branched-chain amino acid transport system permease protein
MAATDGTPAAVKTGSQAPVAGARATLSGAHAADRTRRDWTIFVVLMSLAWTIPLVAGGFYLYLASAIAIYAIAAMGLQVMVGLARQLSLGHAAFMGIGAYTAVLLEKNFGVPFIFAALAALAFSGLIGLLMAQLIRLHGVYFDIATFGFGIIVYQLLANTTWLTGGHVGIRGIPPIEFFGMEFTSRRDLFILEMVTLTIVYALMLRLCSGRIGRAFQAIGQNESAGRSIGIPTNRYRMAVITIGCGIAGLAGAFLPHLLKFLSPESFAWHESLVLLIMITVGGLSSLPGAIIGATVIVIVPEYLRGFAEYKMLIYGLLLITCMITMPAGIAGTSASLASRLWAKVKK